MRRMAHRVRQFAGALRPRVSASEQARARALLSIPEHALFESMTLRDREHGVIVERRVRRQAPDDDVLAVAALLHDCGKGRVALWHRVLFVIARAVAPRWLHRTMRQQDGWRAALWRLEHHPELGAELARQAGAHPDVVRMIREQESPAPDARLRILQHADEA